MSDKIIRHQPSSMRKDVLRLLRFAIVAAAAAAAAITVGGLNRPAGPRVVYASQIQTLREAATEAIAPCGTGGFAVLCQMSRVGDSWLATAPYSQRLAYVQRQGRGYARTVRQPHFGVAPTGAPSCSLSVPCWAAYYALHPQKDGSGWRAYSAEFSSSALGRLSGSLGPSGAHGRV
jgi:hypothetical protein